MISKKRTGLIALVVAAGMLGGATIYAKWAEPTTKAGKSSGGILQRQIELLKAQRFLGKGKHIERRYERLKLQAAKEFEEKKFEKASITYYTIVENPEFAEIIEKDEMEFMLISSLYHNNEDYAALHYIQKTLERGPKNPHFVEVFRILVDTLNRVRDWDEIEPVLATLQSQQATLPEVIREEANYLFGRMAFFKGDYAQAKTIFSSVSSESRFQSRALYHLGVIAAKEENLTQARAYFIKAYSVSESGKDFQISELDEGQDQVKRQKALFQDLCSMAIARLNYSMDKKADYSKVGPNSPYFPVALYESGWAAFRRKDYSTTLKITEGYFVSYPGHELAAEAILLNANAQMEAGRYVTAAKEFGRFIERYESILPILKFIYQNPDATQAYKDFNNNTDIKARPELAAWVYQETKLQNIHKFLDSISREETGVANNKQGWTSVNQLVSEGDKKIVFPSKSNINVHANLAAPAASETTKARQLAEMTRIENELKSRIASLEDGAGKVKLTKGRKEALDREVKEERQRLVALQDKLKVLRPRVLAQADPKAGKNTQVAQVGPKDFQKLITQESDLLPLIESDLGEKRDAFRVLSAKIVQQHVRYLAEELEFEVRKAYLGEIEVAFLQREKAPNEMAAARTHVVTLINKFLVKYSKAPEVPDQMFRLAELSYDDSKQKYFTAQEQFDAQYEKYSKGQITVEPKEPHPDYSESITISEKILKQFPTYKNRDKVLYVLGYYYDEQSSKTKSIATFKQLVDEYPKSEFVVEAHMRLAENFFDLRDLPHAIASYQMVLQYPNSIFYELAIYKIAWSNYRMANYKGAIQYFSKLIGINREPGEELRGTGMEDEFRRRMQDLHKESLKYLALSYSEEGGPSAVIANFKENGLSKYTVTVLGLLSDIYYEQLRYPEAIDATRAYLAYSPYEADGPKYQQRIVDAYDKMGNSDASFRERQRMADLFGPRSDWAQKNRKNTKAITEGETLVKAALIYSATLYHEKAQKASAGQTADNLSPEAIASYKLATEAYKRYIWDFPKSPEAYEMRFNYAECLFTIKDYEAAGYQYQYVARMNLNDGKFLKDSAFNAILSYEALLKGSGVNFESEVEKMKKVVIPDVAKEPAQVAIKPKELNRTQQNLVTAYDNYAAWLPKESKVPEVTFKAALLNYQSENYPEAVKRFVQFNEQFPRHQLAPSAMNYVLIADTTTQNWDQVERVSRKIMKDPILQAKFEQKDLNTLLGVSILYQAELLNKKGELKRASSKYLTIQSELSDNPLAAQGMFNAAAIYEKEGKRDQAIETLEAMVTKYPTSELAPRALQQVAGAHEKALQFEKAAASYERLAKVYPKSEYAADALYNSAMFLEILGQDHRAGENYLAYTTAYPQKADVAEVSFLAAKAFERNGDKEQALALYGDQVDKYNSTVDRKIESHARAGEILESMKKIDLAQDEYKKAFVTFRKNKSAVGDPGRYYAGKAQFARAERVYTRFSAYNLQKAKRVGATLEAKAGLLEEANNLYVDTIEVGHPEWATASLYKIGRGYQSFSEAIFDAPKPAGLSHKDLERYEEELKEQAFPLEDKAIEAYEKALKTAHKINDYSLWTQRILNQLQSYKPAQYPPLYELLPQTQASTARAEEGAI